MMISSLAPKSRPPIPHEHGAWVVLYAPLLITAIVLPTATFAETALLVGLITMIFLARNCVSIVLRRKRDWENAAGWLAIFSAAGLAFAWPLVAGPNGAALLMVGAIGMVLFILHSMLLVNPVQKRLDRSRQGQILAIAALCLNGPAQAAIATGGLPRIAWLIWICCTIFFGSSVYYVKMLLDAAKFRDRIDLERARLSRDNNLYHRVMTAGALGLGLLVGGWQGLVLCAAIVPAAIRGFHGARALSATLPPLKLIGLREVAYSLWFTAGLSIALRGL